MNIQKKKDFIINAVYVAILLILLVVLLKCALPVLMPFILGFLVAMILKPVIRFVHKKTKMNKNVISIISFLVFYGTIGVLLALLGTKIVISLRDLFVQLPDIYVNSIEPDLVILFDWLEGILPQVSSFWESSAQSITQSLMSFVTSLSSGAVNFIAGFATQVPFFIVKVLLVLISSFFFTVDYDKVTSFVLRQFSPAKQKVILGIMHNSIGTFARFIKAYAILMSLTFIELAIGLSILRVEHAILLSALIAVIDVLPVLGTGTVLIPWTVISLITGDIAFAIGMLVLYVIIWCVRQLLEPKVVGEQIGLHPIVTLMCMFVGVTFFGFLGLFMLPLIATIITKLNDDGTIHLFK